MAKLKQVTKDRIDEVLGHFAEQADQHSSIGADSDGYIRSVLTKEIREPLGLRWMNYGVAPEDAAEVALDAITGVPPVPPHRTHTSPAGMRPAGTRSRR